MRKIVVNGSQIAELKEKKAKTIKMVNRDMSLYINEHIKIGSDFEIETDNVKVRSHKGKYYLLFIEEFYLDSSNRLRIVYSGDITNAIDSLYKNVGNESVVRVLKSSNKKAYRVAKFRRETLVEVKTFTYKNKSSQNVEQVYLSLFDAINYASKLYKEDSNFSYSVITPKETELFRIG